MSIFKYFSKEEYANDFLERGEVQFRSLAYFRMLENDRERGDPNDGELNHEPKDGLILTKEDGTKVKMPEWRFVSSSNSSEIFVFCASLEFSREIAEKFGLFCVEIVHPVSFVAKLKAKLRLRTQFDSRNVYFGNVEYRKLDVAPNADWALPEKLAFVKPEKYSDQNEFRFAIGKKGTFKVHNVETKLQKGDAEVVPNQADPNRLVIKLGNLEKISKIHDFSKI